MLSLEIFKLIDPSGVDGDDELLYINAGINKGPVFISFAIIPTIFLGVPVFIEVA